MAEADRTAARDRTNLPSGLLDDLVAVPPAGSRVDEVARARRLAEVRAFDDGAVVEAIASELLLLSAH
ncbi:MAG TPA: hypothetical protein VM143_15535 [Acidimicrobiales bacterium]|nr:hypothetical protein [Acidimicrobiales bacterium]